ncbi:class I adenylate-forming enzyme family protein [Nocardia carnea]|uniref:class I adenylate-forming enzyme family protein n=1 Tax=Nocardia carnea TaxID=37328 RepID=UPI00245661BD|nr:class I adenylate-forming enzyme family protein [Nocardia carnea]
MTGFAALPNTLWGLLAHRAALAPDSIMLIDEHDHSVTFAAMVQRAQRVAAGLHDLGVRAGDTVSWQLPTRIDTVVLSLALARLGVTQNPIIPVYRSREVAAMVRQCGAAWFVTLENFRGFDHGAMAREIGAENGLQALVLAGELPVGDPAGLGPPPESGDAIRWIYTTSGTTAAPKGVCHSDGSLIAGGLGVAEALAVSRDDMSTIFFPFAHIGGPDMMIAGLAVGMPILMSEIFEPAAALASMQTYGATVSGGGPSFYTMYLQQQIRTGPEPVVPTLKFLAGGGAPMLPRVYHEVVAGMGIPVLHGYGMTECPMITQGRPGDSEEQLTSTAGRPVLGCEIAVRSESGRPLGPETEGQVWVRGAMLFHHYLVDGDIVVPHDEDGWFFTGDIGYLRPDGHVVLVGREKDLIIRKGESISPMEIEDVLGQHPAVQDVAVIGLPDDVRGERICAVLELVAGAAAPTVAGLREHCLAAGLAPFKSPEQVEVVDSMPKTPTMKIRKHQLRNRFDTGDRAVAPTPQKTGAGS